MVLCLLVSWGLWNSSRKEDWTQVNEKREVKLRIWTKPLRSTGLISHSVIKQYCLVYVAILNTSKQQQGINYEQMKQFTSLPI